MTEDEAIREVLDIVSRVLSSGLGVTEREQQAYDLLRELSGKDAPGGLYDRNK